MNRLDFRRRIDSLKSTISITDLVERDGHKLTRNGGLMKLCCPFHREKTPSCVLYDDHGHCFGCDAHFDIFQYVMLRDHCDFKAAVEKLDGGNSTSSRRSPRRVIQRPKEPEIPEEWFTEFLYECRRSTLVNLMEEFADSLGVGC